MTLFKTIAAFRKKTTVWAASRYVNLAIFNTLAVILSLLHVAKYFHPFWMITINIIIFILLIASVLLLGARSRALFLISLLFLLFSGFVKILGIGVWAERIAIYMFQALLLGILLLFIENVGKAKLD